MVETLEIFGGFQLQRQEIDGKYLLCLLRAGKIVFVSWDRITPDEIKRVIAQVEEAEKLIGATK